MLSGSIFRCSLPEHAHRPAQQHRHNLEARPSLPQLTLRPKVGKWAEHMRASTPRPMKPLFSILNLLSSTSLSPRPKTSQTFHPRPLNSNPLHLFFRKPRTLNPRAPNQQSLCRPKSKSEIYAQTSGHEPYTLRVQGHKEHDFRYQKPSRLWHLLPTTMIFEPFDP